MARLRESMKVDYEKLEEMEKTKEERVANIFTKAAKQCDDIMKMAKSQANVILSSYDAELVINNIVEYNIVEKHK